MKKRRPQLAIAFILLFAAAGLIAVGATRRVKVYDAGEDDFGFLTHTKVHDMALVADTTFGGIELKDGKLYSTYDRSKPRGRAACPT